LSGLCTAAEREELRTFFGERVASISGGPRDLAQTLEQIDLCVARKAAHQKEMADYLSRTGRQQVRAFTK
jgi:alanyl aminopeptidase